MVRQNMTRELCVVLVFGIVVTCSHAGDVGTATFLSRGEASGADNMQPRRDAAVEAEMTIYAPSACSSDACVAYLKHRVKSHDTLVEDNLRECCEQQWAEMRHGMAWWQWPL